MTARGSLIAEEGEVSDLVAHVEVRGSPHRGELGQREVRRVADGVGPLAAMHDDFALAQYGAHAAALDVSQDSRVIGKQAEERHAA